MNADTALKTIMSLMSQVIIWAKGIAGVVLALLFLATLLSMAGHPIPYIPALKGSLQELGVFFAGAAFFVRG